MRFKKIINYLVIITFLLFPFSFCLANTYSADLEKDSSQYFSITDASQTGLDITEDITVEAFVKYETIASGDYSIIASKFLSAGDQRSWAFGLVDAAGVETIRFFYTPTGLSAAADYKISNNQSLSAGTWYHVAVTLDASIHTAIFYLDGVATGTDATGDATSIYDSSADFVVGNYANLSAGNYWDGKIDELRIWNDVRTPQEIADNYNVELTGSEDNLVGYWKFENDATDETSNSNDLTNNNSVPYSTDVPFSGGTPPEATIPQNKGIIIWME